MSQTNVFLLPELITNPAVIRNSCCVVIDVLRATTTMVHALGNGASSITPALTVDEARQHARVQGGLLGGERDCVRLEGFDLGNSPIEYSAEKVAGKSITMTTTNGTKAMMACLEADRILIAAFANLDAVASAIADQRRVNIICAGTNGQITLEDTLMAGALASGRGYSDCNDQTLLAIDSWKDCQTSPNKQSGIVEKLMQSEGGKNLQQVGMVSDIKLCAKLNTYSVLPTLSPQTKTIQL